MIRRTYFAEVRETPRKHENSKKALILGVPEFFVEGHCTRSVNLHCTVLQQTIPARAADGANCSVRFQELSHSFRHLQYSINF